MCNLIRNYFFFLKITAVFVLTLDEIKMTETTVAALLFACGWMRLKNG
jgi:hypothetical protein